MPIRVPAEMEPVSDAEKSEKNAALKGFGCLLGKIAMAAYFDETLEDFKRYL
jgi:hypothetical protein